MSPIPTTGNVSTDPTYGFRRLDPMPTQGELDAFYRDRYMELMEAGGRAPEIRKLLSAGDERQAELAWLRSSLYADVDEALARSAGGRRGALCDVGSGTGDFIAFAGEQGWAACGLEPSRLACDRAQSLGLAVENHTLESFMEAHPERVGQFDAVTMLYVLEHVPDPAQVVQQCRRLLKPGSGLLTVVVPNDFNAFQTAAVASLGVRRWWIAVPDHVNYFDFPSLSRLLEGCGFTVVDRTAAFPMELFLLMGENYIDQPALGPACHARRVQFERSIPVELRRSLYRRFAELGLGRNCQVVASAAP